MNTHSGLIRAGLLSIAITVTSLAAVALAPTEPLELNTLGEAAVNTAPAISISLAGKTEPARAPAKPEAKPQPQPEPEPEPEPEPDIVAPAPEPQPVPGESAPEMAEPETSPSREEGVRNQQVELNAGSSSAVDNYLTRLTRHLSRFYDYPHRARRLGQEGAPVVVFRFRRDGSLIDHHLQRGSGHDLLDEAALAMLRQAAPLPAVPVTMTGEQFSYALPVRFRLR